MQTLIPVLGIDDDIQDVETMSHALESNDIPDYYFFPEAGEFFAVFTPNYRVIIIDLNLPGMNGQAILDKVIKICSKCRAIVISGVLDQEMWMRLQILGAKDFIVKKGKDWANQLALKVKEQLNLAQEELEEEELERRQEEEKRRQDKNELQQIKTLLGKR